MTNREEIHIRLNVLLLKVTKRFSYNLVIWYVILRVVYWLYLGILSVSQQRYSMVGTVSRLKDTAGELGFSLLRNVHFGPPTAPQQRYSMVRIVSQLKDTAGELEFSLLRNVHSGPPTAVQHGRYSVSAEGYGRWIRIFSSPKRPFQFYGSTSFLLNGNRGFFHQG
jgi:hypothetical protein